MSEPTDPDLPSSWQAENDEAGGSGRKPLLLIGGAIVALVLIAGVIALVLQNDPEETVWPPDVGGRAEGLGEVNVPASELDATAEPGVYLWNDFDGWHLWVVNGEGVSGASGTIRANDEVGEASLAIDGAGTVSAEDEGFTFDLPGEPGLVGIDFNPGFFTSELVIELRDGDGPLDPSVVTLGRSGTVDEVPFTLEKIPAPDDEE